MVTETLAQIAYFVIHLPLWGRSRAVFGALLSSESNVSSRFSFFLFLTVFSQPFTEKMDTPSPHSIEWDGIKHLSEEKEHGQASYVLILIGTVNKYTTLVDSWIIIYCITTKQPGYSEVSDMVSSLAELGWEAECYYSGSILLDPTTISLPSSTNFFLCQNISAGPRRFFLFCHAKAKLPGKHWTSTFCRRKTLRRFRRFLRKKWSAAARANWKTNLRESRGIPGSDPRCRWLTPLFAKQMKSIFALSYLASTAEFLVDSRTWIPLRNLSLLILYSQGINFKIATALVNFICS